MSEYFVAAGQTFTRIGEDRLMVAGRGKFAVMTGQDTADVLAVLHSLDGQRGVVELSETTGLSRQKVQLILDRLHARGDIVGREDLLPLPGINDGASLFMHEMLASKGRSSQGSQNSLSVGVAGEPDMSDRLASLLGGTIDCSLVRWEDDEGERDPAKQPDLWLWMHSSRNDQVLRSANSSSLHSGIPWCAAWLEGTHGFLTHVIEPRQTACYSCLMLRERSNAASDEVALAQDASRSENAVKSSGSFLAATDFLVSALALRAAAHLVGSTPLQPVPTMLEVDFSVLGIVNHPVLRLPGCSACSGGHRQI